MGQPQKQDWYEIAKLYADGMSTPKLAKKYGWHHSTVIKHLKAHGVQMRGSGKYSTSAVTDRWEKWAAAYKSGMNTVQIAAASGVSKSCVVKALTKIGVPRRWPSGRPKTQDDFIDYSGYRKKWRAARAAALRIEAYLDRAARMKSRFAA